MKGKRRGNRVISELDARKGIGVWSAELTFLRGMQSWDVLLADDNGVRQGHLYMLLRRHHNQALEDVKSRSDGAGGRVWRRFT